MKKIKFKTLISKRQLWDNYEVWWQEQQKKLRGFISIVAPIQNITGFSDFLKNPAEKK